MRPIRSCVVCRKKQEKSNLIRIVADEKLDPIYDKDQNINSRGFYICNDRNCLEKVKKIIERNKFNVKIDINKQSLLELVKKIENELGE